MNVLTKIFDFARNESRVTHNLLGEVIMIKKVTADDSQPFSAQSDKNKQDKITFAAISSIDYEVRERSIKSHINV